MGYFSREDEKRKEDIYNWKEQYYKRNVKEEAAEKKTNLIPKSQKQELIDSILEQDPTRNREILEGLSLSYLNVILKNILARQKRALLERKKEKRYQNPFEKCDQDYGQEDTGSFGRS